MSFKPECPEVAFAIDTTRRAGKLARLAQQRFVTMALTKDDRSPVTVADFGVQALVGSLLEQHDPSARLVAEEESDALKNDGATLTTVTALVAEFQEAASEDTVCAWIDRGGGMPNGRYWVLDPIDGTKGFLRREQYAVAFALIQDGRVEVGVLACPHLTGGRYAEPGGPGCIVVAVRHQGTWCAPLDDGEFVQLHVSDCTNPAQARVLRSAEAAHTNVSRLDRLLQGMGIAGEPVCMDSQAKYAVLAAGGGELLFRLLSSKQPDYRERIWDQAAGSLVVEEAGGRITDLEGKPLDFSAGRTLENNRGVLASNGGPLHDAALEALQSID